MREREWELVESKADIYNNIKRLYKALTGDDEDEKEEAKKLITNGVIFVVSRMEADGYIFAPNRFVGHKYINDSDNTNDHYRISYYNTYKAEINGGRTSSKIDRHFGSYIMKGEKNWQKWEYKYLDFCRKFGINPAQHNRKYWISDGDDGELGAFKRGIKFKESNKGSLEGGKTETVLTIIERDPTLRKQLLAAREWPLCCEMCDINWPNAESWKQEAMLEAHHINPLHKRGEGVTNPEKDMALLCACCHRLIHRAAKEQGVDYLPIKTAREYVPQHKRGQ